MYQDAHGRTYEVEVVKDDKGAVKEIRQPVVETAVDLERKFGSARFRRLPESEVHDVLREAPEEPVLTPPAAPSAVAAAVQQGAAAIAAPPAPPGRKVTKRFPEAVKAGLTVYLQSDGLYTVAEEDAGILGHDLAREQVTTCIEEYLET